MPKICYHEDVKVLKKPFKAKFILGVKILLFCIVVVGCFFSASYLSSALTVGNLGALIVYGDTKLKLKDYNLYAVMLGEYDTREEADKVAITSTIQGASGYVWQDSKYYVVGSIYSTMQDAEKVINNLNESNYNVMIKEIKFDKKTLSFDMYKSEDMPTINNSIQIFDKLYEQLYEYSISFDKGEINNLAVSSELSEVRGNLKNIIISVQRLLDIESSELKKIQEALIELDELLDQTIIKTIDNSATGYTLKNSIARVVRIKYDLFVEL